MKKFLVVVLVVALAVAAVHFLAPLLMKSCGGSIASCIYSYINPLETKPRGAGVPMVCAADEDEQAGLCYKKCPEGYTGVAFVCWQNCPENYRDDGAYCFKPDGTYGRGAGYGDQKTCEKEETAKANKDKKEGETKVTVTCEKPENLPGWLLWYPKCKDGYYPSTVNICSPKCPDGMADIGISCTKRTSNRGAGVILHACPEGMEKDGALCYPLCPKGFHGVGPVCWEDQK